MGVINNCAINATKKQMNAMCASLGQLWILLLKHAWVVILAVRDAITFLTVSLAILTITLQKINVICAILIACNANINQRGV